MIVGPRDAGKTELWVRLACDLSRGPLALYEAGASLRLTPAEARRRFASRLTARERGASADAEEARAVHGVRRFRVTPGLPMPGQGPMPWILWLVDGPGLAVADSSETSWDARNERVRGPKSHVSGPDPQADTSDPTSLEVSRLVEHLLTADALIQVHRAAPGREADRLDRALRDLAGARGLEVFPFLGRQPGSRMARPGERLVEDARFGRDLKHLEREVLRRYGHPERPGPNRGIKTGGGVP